MITIMCTERQLDTIFGILKERKTIKVKPFDNKVFSQTGIEISSDDALDGFERLKKLGFANSTTFLNGNKSIEITDQGKRMFKAIY